MHMTVLTKSTYNQCVIEYLQPVKTANTVSSHARDVLYHCAYLAFLFALYVLCQGCRQVFKSHPAGSQIVTEPSIMSPSAQAASLILQ